MEKNKQINEFINDLLSNELSFKKGLSKEEIITFLKSDQLVDTLADIIYTKNKRKEQINKKFPDNEVLIKYNNIEKLIQYMYYDYTINIYEFEKIAKQILSSESQCIIKELLDNEIVKITDNHISLTKYGIAVAVFLGFSFEDENKEEFIKQYKKNIDKY